MKAIICVAIIGVSILGAGLMVGGRYAITLVDEPKYHASTRKSAQSFLKLDTLTGKIKNCVSFYAQADVGLGDDFVSCSKTTNEIVN